MATKKIVSTGTTPATTVEAAQFTPTPEAKKQAGTYRIIAVVLWVLAIAAEAFTIFWVLRHTELNGFMIWLIALIVVIGVLALAGSLLWKKANRFDPASKKDPVRFFIQNQLGVFITLLAFVPLIVLIFLNKDMDKNQKTIAGIVGIIVALGVGLGSADFVPPSQEDISQDAGLAVEYTGTDTVYWVKGGKVYHLCAEYPAGTNIPALSRGGADNVIYAGTVSEAVQAGKTRLSMYGFKECGLTEGEPTGKLPVAQTGTYEEDPEAQSPSGNPT